jgi:SNF2 family DNA or RNA helicase
MRDLCLEEVPGITQATLIVCPEAILDQWLEEIRRHTEPSALKVIVYHGQKAALLSSHDGVPLPLDNRASSGEDFALKLCVRFVI